MVCAALIHLAAAVPSFPQAASAASSPVGVDLGLLFNLSTPFPAIEGYQGGIGGKIGFGRNAVRLLVNNTYSSATSSLAVDFGAVYEYHLTPWQVSPYIGLSLEGGYMAEGASLTVIPVSFGAVAGAEVFLLDFLSVFAEYALSFDLTIMTSPASPQPTFSYLVGTRMGNASKIGVVVYLTRSGGGR